MQPVGIEWSNSILAWEASKGSLREKEYDVMSEDLCNGHEEVIPDKGSVLRKTTIKRNYTSKKRYIAQYS